MEHSDVVKLADACKSIGVNLNRHPYNVAHEVSFGLSVLPYPDCDWLAYRIKMEIYKNTDERTVPWKLPEPAKPHTFTDPT